VKLAAIRIPAQTVGLFESGLPKEEKAHPLIKGYSGGPKGSAKSVVARYKGGAVIGFLDGRVALVATLSLLTAEGTIPWNEKPAPNQLLWTADGSDPNR
jgi:hypothetical protein